MEAFTAIRYAIIWGIRDQPISILVSFTIALLGCAYVLSQKRPPGPSVLLGQTLPLLGDTLAVKKNPCAYFIEGYLRYGGVYKTSMLGLPIYVVLEPSAVREMLRGEGCTFSVPFKSFNALLEDWDHMVDSKQHDFWRKAISTALSHASIESYIPALAGIIQQNIQQWAEQGSTNLMEGTGDMALDFAIEVLVGVPLAHTDRAWLKANMLQYFKGLYAVPLPLPGSTFSKAKAAKAALLAALERELGLSVTDVLQEDPTAGEAIAVAAKLVHVDGAGKHALLHSDTSLQFNQQHFAASMARLKEREAAALAASSSNGKHAQSMVANSSFHQEDALAGNVFAGRIKGCTALALAHAGHEHSPQIVTPLNMADAQLEVLRGQRRLSVSTAAMRVLGTLIGAVDTTRYQIFSVLGILAQLPEHVEALRKEQQQVLTTHGPDLTPAALAAMPLLEASIKECTRLLSASRVVMRQAVQPLSLQGVAVPAGAYMIFSVDFLHAIEPSLWQGPSSILPGRHVPPWMDWKENLREAFKPERWLRGNASKPKHMFTFGVGPHLCLGMNLVFTEIKLLVALLLREGLEWHFADPDVLKKMTVFPGLRPQPGTDELLITRKQALGVPARS